MKTKFLSALLSITLATASINAYGASLYDEYIKQKEASENHNEDFIKNEEIKKAADEDYKLNIENQKIFCQDMFDLFSEPVSSIHFSCIVFYHNNDLTAYNKNTKEYSKVIIEPEKLIKYHLQYLNEFMQVNNGPDINYRTNLFLVSLISTPQFYIESYPFICLYNYISDFEVFDYITRNFLCSQSLFIGSNFRAHEVYLKNIHDNITDATRSLNYYIMKLFENNKFDGKVEKLILIIDEFSENETIKISNLLAAKFIAAGNGCTKNEKIDQEIKKINHLLIKNSKYGSIGDKINELLDYYTREGCKYYLK